VQSLPVTLPPLPKVLVIDSVYSNISCSKNDEYLGKCFAVGFRFLSVIVCILVLWFLKNSCLLLRSISIISPSFINIHWSVYFSKAIFSLAMKTLSSCKPINKGDPFLAQTIFFLSSLSKATIPHYPSNLLEASLIAS